MKHDQNETSGVEPPKKKLQVFISSPFEGMEDYRRAVMEGVVRAGHVPILLENFSFSVLEDIPVIVNALKNCQVYILILGHRYGSIVPEPARRKVCELCRGLDATPGISFTELEYRLAKHLENRQGDNDNIQLAIFTVLFDREQVDNTRKRKPEGRGPQERAKLDSAFWDFYVKVESEKKFGKPLSYQDAKVTTRTLSLEIELALEKLDVRSLQGWIPEPRGIPPKLLPAISQNRLTQAIIASLGMFGSLDERLAREPELKERAAAFFWEQYGTAIYERDINLFFESGSTIAFLADAVGKKIAGRHRVSSNNVLAHLLLWMVHRGSCEMFPNTTPDPTDKFGATFGAHIDRLYEQKSLNNMPPEPDYTGRPLDDQERQAISKTMDEAAAPNHWAGKTLLLGATSGIQMGGSPKLVWGKGTRAKEELRQKVNMCRGFHVGSYKNKMFKRFMYETRLPLMVFLDESKINSKIQVGRCHFIFDRKQYTWEKFMRTYPVGFCVGCHSTNLANCVKLFENKGFEIVRDKGTYEHRAFIARNAAFVKKFDS